MPVKHSISVAALAAVTGLSAPVASASIIIPTVPVGDAGNAPDSPLIRLSLRADSNNLNGRARLERIYRPRLSNPKGEKGPFGLTRYGFSAGSGYQDYELFAGESGADLELLLCEHGSSQFPSPNCLVVDRPLTANVSFSYRFKRAYLARWRDIATGVEKLIGKFRG